MDKAKFSSPDGASLVIALTRAFCSEVQKYISFPLQTSEMTVEVQNYT